MSTVQEKRRATMSRLSYKPGKPYDIRQHRRAAYVSVKFARGLGIASPELVKATRRVISRLSVRRARRRMGC
jgi:hypothetical protein